jgi:hypothetical protein
MIVKLSHFRSSRAKSRGVGPVLRASTALGTSDFGASS